MDLRCRSIGDEMPLVREIEVSELNELLNDEHQQVDIFDVRSSHEVSKGSIPQAQHMPLHVIPSKVVELSDKRPIVLFCNLGVHSVQACQYLQNAGFDNVFMLRGGFNAWQASGLCHDTSPVPEPT